MNVSINSFIIKLINSLINLWPAYSTFVFPTVCECLRFRVCTCLRLLLCTCACVAVYCSVTITVQHRHPRKETWSFEASVSVSAPACLYFVVRWDMAGLGSAMQFKWDSDSQVFNICKFNLLFSPFGSIHVEFNNLLCSIVLFLFKQFSSMHVTASFPAPAPKKKQYELGWRMYIHMCTYLYIYISGGGFEVP